MMIYGDIRATYAALGAPSGGILRTLEKIQSFRNNVPGWHYGQGVPANDTVISRASAIVLSMALAGIEETSAFPGIDGEIMVTGYDGAHYYEAIVETDGSISLTYEFQDAEKFSKERMPEEEATTKLQQLLGERWNTSGSYILNILTVIPSKIGSRVWLSGIPQMAVGHPLSNASVLTVQTTAFATTLDATTQPGLQANHPFFGYLTKESFQRAIG
jgi:hypothetical protein